jgi:hypothetical protein
MQFLKLAKTEAEFNLIKESDSTLPLVASFVNQVYYISAQVVNSFLDAILDGASGTQTSETNYVSQINSILATYVAPTV